MSMMDFAGALGGGAPPEGGGMPPPEAAAPQDDNAQGGEQYETSLDALDGAEEALHAFIKLDPDDSDKAVAAQCLQNILKLKAANQQDSQQGGMKSLTRALAGQAGAGAASGGY
jgi:hypothetical protein